MIVTLTPNPSVDRTLEVPSLEHGEVVRATRSLVEAGGKGVNVARALAKHGIDVTVILPIGGPDGAQLESLIQTIGLRYTAVPVAGDIRANVSLVEPDGSVTKINAPGPALSDHEIASLRRATTDAAASASWVAACGSLPPGMPDDSYPSLVTDLRATGSKVAVDTSGRALATAIGAEPDLIKPNAEELSELVGRPLTSMRDVVDAANTVLWKGVGAVLVSLGADGAVLVDRDGATQAWTEPVVPKSNVGAGDATLAGFLAAGGSGVDALRRAVAFGTAAVQLPGSAMPGPGDVHEELVHTSEVDLDRGLGTKGGST